MLSKQLGGYQLLLRKGLTETSGERGGKSWERDLSCLGSDPFSLVRGREGRGEQKRREEKRSERKEDQLASSRAGQPPTRLMITYEFFSVASTGIPSDPKSS